jgi:hypothetical protein
MICQEKRFNHGLRGWARIKQFALIRAHPRNPRLNIFVKPRKSWKWEGGK